MVVDGHGGWCGAAEGEESFVVTLRTRFFPAHTPPWKANYTKALPPQLLPFLVVDLCEPQESSS